VNTIFVVGLGCWLLAEALDRIPDNNNVVPTVSLILGIGGSIAVIVSAFL
jgi:Co/Zn/Cd efflux system component